MSQCTRLILLITVVSVGWLQAQRVEETRLLAKTRMGEQNLSPSAALGSKLFVYSRVAEGRGINLFRLEGEREVPVLERTSEKLHNVQVARDDSRIVFATSGITWHYPTVIHSVSPDGSQLRTLVESGDDCRGRFIYMPPGAGSPYCSFPGAPRLSPDGQRILFLNWIRRSDEEDKTYLSMIPVTGGPIVRLKELGRGYNIVWNEDSTSIYAGLTRYDLETGGSLPLTDATRKFRRPSSEVYWGAASRLAVSRADGSVYFVSEQGLTRVEPDTGFTEVVAEQLFDTFDLSPDGRRVVGVIAGGLAMVDLEARTSTPFQVEPGAVDELGLRRILAVQLNRKTPTPARAFSEKIRGFGVRQIRWIDQNTLWGVLGDIASPDSEGIHVGVVRLD